MYYIRTYLMNTLVSSGIAFFPSVLDSTFVSEWHTHVGSGGKPSPSLPGTSSGSSQQHGTPSQHCQMQPCCIDQERERGE